ncbi:MAG: hypothetical protein NT046_12195 [Arenimonas sp.]|nr:hypothetical protein [Arenimonas sp.]
MDTDDNAAHRRFAKRFAPPMGLYVIALMVMIPQIRGADSVATRVALALMPLLPLGWAIVELVRHVSSLDEMQRRQHFESGGIAGLLTSLLVFSWTFMEMAGLPPFPAVLVLPTFCAIFLVRYWQMSRQTA